MPKTKTSTTATTLKNKQDRMIPMTLTALLVQHLQQPDENTHPVTSASWLENALYTPCCDLNNN